MRKLFMVETFALMMVGLVGCGITPKTATNNTGSQPATTQSQKPLLNVNSYNSPEEYIEYIYEDYFIDKKKDVTNIWEDDVSDTTKSIGYHTESSCEQDLQERLFQYNYTEVLISGSEEVENGIYRVDYMYKIQDDNENITTEEESLYVIEENGTYKLLLSGITESISFNNNSDGKDFDLEDLIIYKSVKGISVNYNLINYTGRDVKLGEWIGENRVKLVTDQGEYYTYLNNFITLKDGMSDKETAYFEGSKGNPQQLVIETITYLESNGLPGFPEETTSYTLDLQ